MSRGLTPAPGPAAPPGPAAEGSDGAYPGRVEDPPLLRGTGRFVDDLDLPGMLHATVVRSPYAHARIRHLDPAAIAALPGVATVLRFADIEGVSPIPIRLCPDDALNAFLQYPLAADRVRYAGEPVALVVAASRSLAEDAAAELDIDYEPLPVSADIDAPVEVPLFDTAPDNVAATISASFGDIDAAFASAAHVVRTRFTTGRHTAVPLETRGLVADWNAGRGELSVFGPAKVPHFNRRVLASLLSLPESRIRFTEPDVGGGFGVRGEFYPEDFLVPFAAMRLGRPVKWIEDRLEHLVASNHSRQQRYDLALALDADGRILGLRARLANDMGAYLRTHGTIVPGMSVGMLPGPYRVPAYDCEMRCVLTSKTPTGTYRAPGRYEANAARERLLDAAAARLGIDPVQLRLQNLVQPREMPWDVGTEILGEHTVFDSGDYPYALQRAVALSGFHERRARSRGHGRHRHGIGLACYVEKTGTGPFEGARVAMDRDGRLTVCTGASSVGQGIETALASIAAQAMGLSRSRVTVHRGDTESLAYGIGSFASRATVMAGSAVHQATHRLRERLLSAAAEELGVATDGLAVTERGVQAPDGRACGYARLHELLGPAAGQGNGPEETCYFHCDHMTYSHGVAVVEVRVDTRTGQVEPLHAWVVYDVGRVIDMGVVEGQVIGGVAQGLGGALLEELHYDPEGQLQSGSLMEYLLPTADVVPRVTHERLERSPSTLNPLGVKGAGEIGIAGIGGAIANAVADAVGGGGDHLPMTPERTWRWLQQWGDP